MSGSRWRNRIGCSAWFAFSLLRKRYTVIASGHWVGCGDRILGWTGGPPSPWSRPILASRIVEELLTQIDEGMFV